MLFFFSASRYLISDRWAERKFGFPSLPATSWDMSHVLEGFRSIQKVEHDLHMQSGELQKVTDGLSQARWLCWGSEDWWRTSPGDDKDMYSKVGVPKVRDTTSQNNRERTSASTQWSSYMWDTRGIVTLSPLSMDPWLCLSLWGPLPWDKYLCGGWAGLPSLIHFSSRWAHECCVSPWAFVLSLGFLPYWHADVICILYVSAHQNFSWWNGISETHWQFTSGLRTVKDSS